MNLDLQLLWSQFAPAALNFLGALLILLVGWIVARILSSATRALLRRTAADELISTTLSGEGDDGGPRIDLQSILPRIVFWIVMLFALVAFFNQLDLPAVSTPFQNVLSQIFFFLPGLLGAAAILGIAWAVATLVKFGLEKGLGALDVDGRLQRGGATSEDDVSITSTIANIIYWFLLLLAIPPALDALGMEALMGPIQGMVDEIVGALPNVVKAGLVLLIGWLIGRIIRQIVTSLAAAVGVDQLGEQAGFRSETQVSKLIGTIIFAFILIPTVIAALEALGIEAISVPASAMLALITGALPGIFAAILLLILTFYVGRFVSGLLVNILEGLGFDNVPKWLGIKVAFERSPSKIAGALILAGFMLFAIMEAANLIGFTSLGLIASQVIAFAAEILVGVIVFGLGLLVANFVYNILSASDSQSADLLAKLARAAILILVGTMALRQMGIASETVDLAFGILLGALGIALALSVGLGCREIAAREVDRIIKYLRSE